MTMTAGSKQARFVQNPMLGQELAMSSMFIHALEAVANDVMNQAAQYMPVDTGALRDSLYIEVVNVGGRREARVVVGDWKAVFIEFGTAEFDFNAPLRRAADSLGFRLVDGGEE